MNDLSWFLYLASVLPQVSTAIGVVSLIATAIFGVVFMLYLGFSSSDDPTDSKIAESVRPYRNVWVVTVAAFVLTFLVPDRETFYAIAASEVGEEVLKSKVGTKATQALEAWLDKQIENNKEETNDR